MSPILKKPFKNMELKLNNFSYDEIKVGQEFSFERLLDKKAVAAFADLTGDQNPLHVDEAYAIKTKFGGPIAHGMLMGSLFSALVGMLCPGKRCLYLSQTLKFKNPLKVGDVAVVSGRVTDKSEAGRIITIETLVKDKNDKVLVEGEAKVQI